MKTAEKKSISDIISIKNIPKVELHRHLDCSWRYSTLTELAQEYQWTSKEKFKQIESDFLVTEPMNDLTSVLKKFTKAQKILSHPGILQRLTYEVLEDAYNDGIRLIELRYSLNFIQEVSQLSFEKIHFQILDGINQAQKKFPIATGLISILQRGQSAENLKKVLDFTLQNKNTFIAIDLADSEEKFNTADYIPFFDKAHDQGMPITIHCGETPDSKAANRVKEAVEKLHAKRIGHGIQTITNREIIEFIKLKNIHLEVCPLSNVLTKAFMNLPSHPFNELYQNGVSLSINSDDPGIFNTNLSDDYSFLVREFNYTKNDFHKINELALKHSFLPLDIKQQVSNQF
ncbi:MAG: adenosine deaminase [Bdellovibrionaceae bacterium]|nr:adenosine deaminase [Pseudobdellovibrionaceae bacterium]NUM58883.1 adenosine deaminase [Pseudobdellovibrionaceae bacterium]